MSSVGDQLTAAVLEVRRRPANKTCFECGTNGPQAVVLDFNVFVCMVCSGLHREFSHRVKGISMSSFSANEVAAIEAGGNDAAARIWRATLRNREAALATLRAASVPQRDQFVRQQIRQTFLEKAWMEHPEPEKSTSSSPSKRANQKKHKDKEDKKRRKEKRSKKTKRRDSRSSSGDSDSDSDSADSDRSEAKSKKRGKSKKGSRSSKKSQEQKKPKKKKKKNRKRSSRSSGSSDSESGSSSSDSGFGFGQLGAPRATPPLRNLKELHPDPGPLVVIQTPAMSRQEQMFSPAQLLPEPEPQQSAPAGRERKPAKDKKAKKRKKQQNGAPPAAEAGFQFDDSGEDSDEDWAPFQTSEPAVSTSAAQTPQKDPFERLMAQAAHRQQQQFEAQRQQQLAMLSPAAAAFMGPQPAFHQSPAAATGTGGQGLSAFDVNGLFAAVSSAAPQPQPQQPPLAPPLAPPGPPALPPPLAPGEDPFEALMQSAPPPPVPPLEAPGMPAPAPAAAATPELGVMSMEQLQQAYAQAQQYWHVMMQQQQQAGGSGGGGAGMMPMMFAPPGMPGFGMPLSSQHPQPQPQRQQPQPQTGNPFEDLL